MSSQVDICNLALSFLGAGTITSLADNTVKAQVLNAEYNIVRDSELRNNIWRFSITRVSLPALTTVPPNGPFTAEFQLPSDCVRVLMVGDFYPAQDIADYRTSPSNADYVVEGQKIRSNLGAPLSLRYCSNAVDVGSYDPSFVNLFAAKLAWKSCERITQNAEKRKLAIEEYNEALKAAMRANALEKPSEFTGDDSWVLSRMQ